MTRAAALCVSLFLGVAGSQALAGKPGAMGAHVLSRFGLEADVALPEGARVKVGSSSPNFSQTVLERRALYIDLMDGVSLHISEVPADSALGPKQCEPRPGRELITKQDDACIVKRYHGILGKDIYNVLLFRPISSQSNVLKVSAMLTEPVGSTIVDGVLDVGQARQALQVMETFTWHGPGPAELPETAKPRSAWIPL